MAFTWNEDISDDTEIEKIDLNEIRSNIDSIVENLACQTHYTGFDNNLHGSYNGTHRVGYDSTQYTNYDSGYDATYNSTYYSSND